MPVHIPDGQDPTHGRVQVRYTPEEVDVHSDVILVRKTYTIEYHASLRDVLIPYFMVNGHMHTIPATFSPSTTMPGGDGRNVRQKRTAPGP